MSAGWGGADPPEAADGSNYELGTEQEAVNDITLKRIRVHNAGGAADFVGRKGRIWSTTGAQLGIANLPDVLPVGWSLHDLDAPVQRLAGQRWVVSFNTAGYYSALGGALSGGSVLSADGNVRTLSSALATNGNGLFNFDPNLFPTTGSGGGAFYGIDTDYDPGLEGNAAPLVTSFELSSKDAEATAVVEVTDDQNLSGIVYTYDWGDGIVENTASPTADHTYAQSGVYAVMVTATDNGGLSDSAAKAITIRVPNPNTMVAYPEDSGPPELRIILESIRARLGYLAKTPGGRDRIATSTPFDVKSLLDMNGGAGLFVRINLLGGRGDRFEVNPTLDVDVYTLTDRRSGEVSKDLEAILMGYPLVMSSSSGVLQVREVQQTLSPAEVPWENEQVRRYYSSYRLTIRRT